MDDHKLWYWRSPANIGKNMKHSNEEIINHVESILHELKMKDKLGKISGLTVTVINETIDTSTKEAVSYISTGNYELTMKWKFK